MTTLLILLALVAQPRDLPKDPPPLEAVVADGFESGSPYRWSRVVGTQGGTRWNGCCTELTMRCDDPRRFELACAARRQYDLPVRVRFTHLNRCESSHPGVVLMLGNDHQREECR